MTRLGQGQSDRWRAVSRTNALAIALRLLACVLCLGAAAASAMASAQGPVRVEPGLVARSQVIAVVPVRARVESASDSSRSAQINFSGQGAAAGAATGLASGWISAAGIVGSAGPLAPVAAAVAGAVLVGSTAAGAVIGGLEATPASSPPTEGKALADRLGSTFVAEPGLADAIAHAIAGDVALFTRDRAEVVGTADPRGLSAESVPLLRQKGFATIVEIRITGAGYTMPPGQEPAIALYVAAQARMIDTANGITTMQRGLLYETPPHVLEAWSKNDFALSKLEYAKAGPTLAGRVVDDLLLGASVANVAADTPTSRSCGIVPVRPAVEWVRDALESLRPATAAVDSVTPTLAWRAEPSGEGVSPPLPWANAENRRYDLRIWDEIDGAPGALVYERLGLAESEHRVDTALKARSRHFWSVRLRYTVDGQPRATRWGAANLPRYSPAPQAGSLLFRSVRDGETMKTVYCSEAQFTPCACLDFIPARNHYAFRTP